MLTEGEIETETEGLRDGLIETETEGLADFETEGLTEGESDVLTLGLTDVDTEGDALGLIETLTEGEIDLESVIVSALYTLQNPLIYQKSPSEIMRILSPTTATESTKLNREAAIMLKSASVPAFISVVKTCPNIVGSPSFVLMM